MTFESTDCLLADGHTLLPVAMPSRDRSTSTAFDVAIIRVAALPIEAVDELRVPETMANIDRLLAMRSDLDTLKENVLDTLHRSIGSMALEAEGRGQLISFKRDVFNNRVSCLTPAIVAMLPQFHGNVAEDIARLIATRRALDTFREHCATVLAQEITNGQRALKLRLLDTRFRNGLCAASPTLALNLDAYISSEGADNRRLRLAERSSLMYLYRTVCKTSPFSTLTLLLEGRLRSVPAAAGRHTLRPAGTVVSLRSLNMTVPAQLAERLLDDPAIVGHVPVELTSGWKQVDGNIQYLRRQFIFTGGSGPVQRSVCQHLFYLPDSQLLQYVISSLGIHGSMPFGSLIERLHAATGLGKAECYDFGAKLLHLNFLVAPQITASLAISNSLTNFCNNLALFEHSEIDSLQTCLSRVDQLLGTSDTDDPPHLLRHEVRNQLKRAYEILRIPHALMPINLIYEDAALQGGAGPTDVLLSPRVMGSLAVLQSILWCVDVNYVLRLSMEGYFVSRYGEGARVDDLLGFALRFGTDYHRPFWDFYWRQGDTAPSAQLTSPLNHFQSVAVERVLHARRALMEYVQSVFEADTSTIVELDPAKLRGIAASLPTSRLSSNSFFVQLSNNLGHEAVLNKIFSGFGAMFSRFIPLLSAASEENLLPLLRKALSEAQQPGTLFVEMRGGIETTLNVHPRICEYELVLPGESGTGPAAYQVSLNELYLQHDLITKRLTLRSQSHGVEIIPLYFGFLIPNALPLLQQVLLNFSPAYWLDSALWPFLRETSRDTSGRAPRVKLGPLVLQRSSWRMAVGSFPIKARDQSDLDHLTDVTVWRRAHEIPERAFIAGVAARRDPEDVGDKAQLGSKPFYVDFCSALSIALLLRQLAGSSPTDDFLLTEMLPEPVDLNVQSDRGQRVSEVVLEMTTLQGPP